MTLDEKLCTIRDIIQFDIGNRGLARNPERNLINSFPDDFAHACRSIAENPAASVAIVTGFWIANAEPPCGETDGPLGAVYLARAFHSLNIPSLLLSDDFCKQALVVGRDVAGIATDILTIPPQSDSWSDYRDNDWAAQVERRKLTHLIAIERVGPARDGHCYSMRGRDITCNMCPAHLLFEDLPKRHPHLATIGIGDGGNEIGMGRIPAEVIESNVPDGAKIACRVATDRLIVCGISNWGAYGLATGVALARGTTVDEKLFDPELERRVLEAMVERGPLVDGMTGQRRVAVDGVEFDKYIGVLSAIQSICFS